MRIYNLIYKAILLLTVSISLSCVSKKENTTELLKGDSVIPLGPASQNSEILRTEELQPLSPTKIDKMTDADIFQDRDLSLYKKENTNNCNTYKCVTKTLRNFIREHWNNKKRGYIKNELQGIDLEITDHIFIEPTQSGEWLVVWKTIVNHSMSENDEFTESVGTILIDKSKIGNQKLIYKNQNGEAIRQL